MRKRELEEEMGRAPYIPDNCPKCGTRMVFDEEERNGDIGMTEGEQAECLAGMRGNQYCPKCGHSEEFEY
jgi:predicted nucleic-acid-binding Zn-ribbon protein